MFSTPSHLLLIPSGSVYSIKVLCIKSNDTIKGNALIIEREPCSFSFCGFVCIEGWKVERALGGWARGDVMCGVVLWFVVLCFLLFFFCFLLFVVVFFGLGNGRGRGAPSSL